ncbi:GDSL esterase/lipase [Melia azedarach]|uniref:GDSL esterase/lipase n=1 Tax=Melia azedarach TaxID=155640 RepID=A0ACC1WWX5_MELAZ|nr:GDSL esterase/lipase [Melia azedarach]
MEGQLRRWWVVCAVVMGLALNYGAKAESQVPCYFIFGDSLVDNGNNNQLSSLARADYLPYGIDFPNGPTGRFSNGKTTVDVIAELLGFDGYIPPYSTARGQDILRGVNYASAAAGIREETGQQLGGRISFSGQVQNYRNTAQQVVNLLGDENAAANYLRRCIYSIGLGSNDYLNNYFQPLYYSTGRQYTPEQYADVLIRQYSQQLQALYDYGARKFALIGVGQIGCSPNQLAQNSPDGRTCVQRVNDANQLFNNKLKALVDQFNNNDSDAKFIYINAYGIFQDITSNPGRYGFRVTNTGCCGVGRNNGQITCLPLQTPCQNRKEYVFWDAFHPTEAANTIFARRSYSAQSPSDAYPIDIRRLAQL